MKKIVVISLLTVGFLYICNINLAFAKKVYPIARTSKGLAPYLYLPDNPTPAVIKINEAKQAWFEERYQEACDLWRESLNLNPYHPEGIWHDIGMCSMKLAAYDDAIVAYSNAIKLYPKETALAYRERGHAYLKAGDTENANKDFQKANAIALLNLNSSHKTSPANQTPKHKPQNNPVHSPKTNSNSQPILNKIQQYCVLIANSFKETKDIKLLLFIPLFILIAILKVLMFIFEDRMIRYAKSGNLEAIKKELMNRRNINERHGKMGVTLLMIAAQYGHFELVQYLLNRGAMAELQDIASKDTALFYAVEQENPKIVEILLDRGANINAKDSYGLTPLMQAIMCWQQENVELLIKRGADLDLKDNEGATAYGHALAEGQRDIARLLLKNGATKNETQPQRTMY